MPKEREERPKKILSTLEKQVIQELLGGKTIHEVVASAKGKRDEMLNLVVGLKEQGILQQKKLADDTLVWELDSSKLAPDVEKVYGEVYGHHSLKPSERLKYVGEVADALSELTGYPIGSGYGIDMPSRDPRM